MDALKWTSEKKAELAPSILTKNEGEAAPNPEGDKDVKGTTKKSTARSEEAAAAAKEGERVPAPMLKDPEAAKKLEKV
jgi:hypothetical protein